MSNCPIIENSSAMDPAVADNEVSCSDLRTGKVEYVCLKPRLQILRSVGQGGCNLREDVEIVQRRLIELGMDWLTATGKLDDSTVQAIRLFQAIISDSKLLVQTGIIKPFDLIEQWMWAQNAPKWECLGAGSVEQGWINECKVATCDQGTGAGHPRGEAAVQEWGTNWTIEAIQRAGARFRAGMKRLAIENIASTPDEIVSPGKYAICVNFICTKFGGWHGHASHQAGMDIDLKIFTHAGAMPATIGDKKNYSSELTTLAIDAFLQDANVKRVLFNDPKIANPQPNGDTEQKERAAKVFSDDEINVPEDKQTHYNHFHVDIRCPEIVRFVCYS